MRDLEGRSGFGGWAVQYKRSFWSLRWEYYLDEYYDVKNFVIRRFKDRVEAENFISKREECDMDLRVGC